MDSLIAFFFGFTALCLLLIAYYLPKIVPAAKNQHFELALINTAAAFAFWTHAIVAKTTTGSENSITLGLFYYLIALPLYASSTNSEPATPKQRLKLAAVAIYSLILMIAHAVYPLDLGSSGSNIVINNSQAWLQLLESILLAVSIIATFEVVGKKIGAKNRITGFIFSEASALILLGIIYLLIEQTGSLLYLHSWAVKIQSMIM